MVNDEWSGAEALENAFRVADEEMRKVERARDEWRARAEAAEARTTPAVSRADVAEALSLCVNPEIWNVTFPVLVNEVCNLFGIESEQAADPVEEKAEELMRVLAPETEDRTWGILTEPAREDFRRLARHVLGQDDRHVDQ